MYFDYIPKHDADETFGYITSCEKFYRFVDEFNIVGVHWSQPQTISASYFLRLLTEGSSARARGYGRGNQENDEYSMQLYDNYYHSLFDHGAMWKLNDGRVVCTAMPYGDEESIISAFNELMEEFAYPDTIKLTFLEDEYRYRPNGNYMIMIYNDESEEQFDPYCSDRELYIKAVQRSGQARIRTASTTSSYVRDKYIKLYAKRRANGFCQLCEEPAPFLDAHGEPFLEVHHVIWLADGGEDSIDNTVALCPNCHTKMHELDLEEDVQKLLYLASQRL